MSEHPTFRVEMERVAGYEYRVLFDWEQVPEVVLDEPEPIGKRKGPNASRLLAAPVCLTLSAPDSGVFARSGQDPAPPVTQAPFRAVTTTVEVDVIVGSLGPVGGGRPPLRGAG